MSRLDLPSTLLEHCRGIVHIGGHTGQEAEMYARFNVPVLWVEAVPEYHARLQQRIAHWPLQTSRCALLTSRAGEKKTFHLTGADGQSSSMFPLSDLGRSAWGIDEIGRIDLTTTTLDLLLKESPMPAADGLVIDVQGAEFEVLSGAERSLAQFSVVVCEVSTEAFYTGQASYSIVAEHLGRHGFWPISKPHKSHATVAWARPAMILRAVLTSPTLLPRILKWRLRARAGGSFA